MIKDKIILKQEDLFGTYADAIVLPRSTTGTLSEVFRRGALSRFKIELPETLPYKALGNLEVTRLQNLRSNNNKSAFFMLMATCVDNNMSTMKAIADITDQIVAFSKKYSDVRDIAMPLIGTGAGGLNHSDVYRTIVPRFISGSAENCRLTIYTPDFNIYSNLKAIENGTEDFASERFREHKWLLDNNFLNPYLADRSIYLAGSNWEREEQADRFFSDGIWENGYDDRFIDLTKTIQPGSILILKSTFAIGETGYLRIKGAGVVKENNGDGRRLQVDWRIKNYNSDISEKSGYRRTIAKIEESVFIDILKALKNGQEFLELLFGANPSNDVVPLLPTSQIAVLSSDLVDGDDQLHIQQDVIAFAKLMAAKSFKPPLAIALFGQWGAGKSFFMRKLMDRISLLANTNAKEFYCEGIAQIHFNAWSYLDANLWASIVSRIFEKLYEYINQDETTDAHKKAIQEELLSKLQVANEEVKLIEKQKVDVEDKIKTLEEEKKHLKAKLETEKQKIGKATLHELLKKVDAEFEVEKKIKKALEENHSLQWDREQLERIVPKAYLENPDAAYKQFKSALSFFKTFFDKKKIWSNIGWMAVIVSAIIFIPMIVIHFTDSLKDFNFFIPALQWIAGLSVALGPIIQRLKSTYQKWSPMVAAFWKIKTDYDNELENALFEHEQREKQIKLDIESFQKELMSIEQNLQLSQKIVTDLEFKRKHAMATEVLHSFIEKRCKSEDYRKHLGIVSIIRKDFDLLSDYFIGHQAEFKAFRDRFNRPLERIILYIDDLDRCPEDRVVEVLEAVNLLMAFPLFIVVVGVDPRWVKNALVKKYALQFNNTSIDPISPSDYLEKIFQVPFHLQPASDQSVKTMIGALTTPVPNLSATIESAATEITQENVSAPESEPIFDSRPDEIKTELELAKDEYVVLSENEIKAMQNMSIVVGNNPRAIKRFVNIYQIVRAHENFSYTRNGSDEELMVVLFLLAFLNGKWRKLGKEFLDYAYQLTNYEKLLSEFYEEQAEPIKNRFALDLEEHPQYQNLMDLKMETFVNSHQFIQRFTFDED